MAIILRRLEKDTKDEYGAEVTIQRPPSPAGREVRLRPEPEHLQRLPQMRRGLSPREQPRSPFAPVVHPRFRNVEGLDGHGEGPCALQPSGAAARQILHAGPMSALRSSTLRRCLPGRGDLEGTGRHRGGRLQLVHRLPLLRSRVSISCAAFQLVQAGHTRQRDQPRSIYLSNRIRPQGVMEKCTFCLHRTRNGRLPACLEACPTGARVFGNLLDPNSEIRRVLAHKRVFVLKEELGLKPNFFYFFDV